MTQQRTPLVERTAPWGVVHSTLRQAQKSNRNAPAYSRWVNRPVGRVFAATGYRLGLSPNMISLISALFTFTGIVLLALATPSLLIGVTVAALLVIGYALDSADGQVARLQGGGSLAGEWLDHVIDAFKTSSFHLAVAIMWVRNLDGWDLWTAMVPLVFALQASAWFFTIILTDLLLRNAGAKQQVLAHSEGAQSTLTSIVALLLDYGFLSWTMVLLGWFDVWRWVYIVLAFTNVLLLLAQLPRWYRRVSTAG